MKRKLQALTVVIIAMVFMISFSQDVFAQTQRNPVLEEFTGTWCPWCPCGHDIMEDIVAAIPNAIMIGYHGPANGSDPFSFFSGNSVIGMLSPPFWPSGTADRTGAPDSRGLWMGQMTARNSVPATVAIDVQRSFNDLTREFSATIDFTALTNLSGQYKFSVILLESGMVWNQAGNTSCTGGSNYVHKHVVRDMMNGATGEEIINGTWNTNDVITKTVNHTVPLPGGSGPDMVWDNCDIVVMVHEAASPLYNGEIQQAVEMTLRSPDYVATLSSTSPDIIGDNNMPGEFTSVIENIGLMDDTYDINCTLDGPANWTGGFTTVNGTFTFGETDSVQVATGNSTNITVNINPNGISGSGEATLSFESKNNPGNVGSITLRLVTTTGIDILVVDASEGGYGEYVSNSLENVFLGTVGNISRNAFNPSATLDNFQMISWSAGIALPAFYPDEVDLLQDYLDNGGKLFINGQDIGEDIFGVGGQSQFAQGFYNNYLHASFVGAGTSYLINGIASDPITDGISFVFNFNIYPPLPEPDNIEPYDASASAIFTFLNGPSIAGIKAATNDYKVVYFGFCFEQIPESDDRDTLVSRIINWSGLMPTNIADDKILPYEFSLDQNYPNPFNPSTRISYSLNDEVQVNLSVYDMLGRKVAELVNSKQSAGSYSIQFDASSVASGTYFYKLTAGEFISVKKMVLLK